MNTEDTIVAIASPPGGALRGILRLSGPQVVTCLDPCLHVAWRPTPAAAHWGAVRQASVLQASLEWEIGATPLPCDLYFWPGPRSYTRQTVAELHTLGSPPLLQAAVQRLCQAGARLAQPGEFTLRAFLAGRIDLTQAEAVLGVIDARSRRQLDSALAQLAGGLAQPLTELRNLLLDLVADLEAGLDFVDEDLDFVTPNQANTRMAQVITQVTDLENRLAGRSVETDTFRVVLIGWPNVGKSSLFNALVGQQAALVADLPGTTRDYVCGRLQQGGRDCLVVDTAGVEPRAETGLAGGAQAMRQLQTEQADLQLWCLDATRPLNRWERAHLQQPSVTPRLLVLTKSDQTKATDLARPALETSARTGRGLEDLREAILRHCEAAEPEETAAVASTATRCRESLRRARTALQQAAAELNDGLGDELVAASLHAALDELGQVAGTVYTEDLLERIFSRFCIGK